MSLEDRIKYASMKARHKKVLRPWYKKWWGVLILLIIFIIVVVLIIASLIVINEVQSIKQGNAPKYLEQQVDNYVEALRRPSSANLGPADAPLAIIEFSDFLDPKSREAYLSLKEIKEQSPDKLRWIHRDFPQSNSSILLALIARCSGEQGKYWPMHDLIFDNQAVLQLLPTEDLWLEIEKLEGFPALTLNLNQYRTCINSEKFKTIIEQDINDGMALRLKEPFTPTWFLNLEQLPNYLSAEQLNLIIENLE